MSLSNTLFPVPLRPSTARVSPRFTRKLIPFKTLWPAERLVHVLDGNNGHRIALARVPLASPQCHKLWPYLFHACFKQRLWKKTRMNFTRTTSARMRKSEASTTELVAARPTPAAPPRVRIP